MVTASEKWHGAFFRFPVTAHAITLMGWSSAIRIPISSLWRATRSNGDEVIDLQHNSQGVGNSGLSMRKAGGFVQREAVILTGGI